MHSQSKNFNDAMRYVITNLQQTEQLLPRQQFFERDAICFQHNVHTNTGNRAIPNTTTAPACTPKTQTTTVQANVAKYENVQRPAQSNPQSPTT